MTSKQLSGLTVEQTRLAVGWNKLIEVFDKLADMDTYEGYEPGELAHIVYRGRTPEGSPTELKIDTRTTMHGTSTRSIRQNTPSVNLYLVNSDEAWAGVLVEDRHFDELKSQDGSSTEIIPSWEWYTELEDFERKTVDDVVNSVYKELTTPEPSSVVEIGR